MKWLKYQVMQCAIGEETLLVNKKVGYNSENLAIAQSEAYNGYEIIEDDTPDPEFEKIPKKVSELENDLGFTPNAVEKAGGTMTGTLTAYNNATVATSCVRNISIYPVASIPASGANGSIAFGYE